MSEGERKGRTMDEQSLIQIELALHDQPEQEAGMEGETPLDEVLAEAAA